MKGLIKQTNDLLAKANTSILISMIGIAALLVVAAIITNGHTSGPFSVGQVIGIIIVVVLSVAVIMPLIMVASGSISNEDQDNTVQPKSDM